MDTLIISNYYYNMHQLWNSFEHKQIVLGIGTTRNY